MEQCGSSSPRRLGAERSFASILEEAASEVPDVTQQMIRKDAARTWSDLPKELLPELGMRPRFQEALQRILVSVEWWQGNATTTEDLGMAYTQGMNYLAAVALMGIRAAGVLDGERAEELAFWLLNALFEGALGPRFFAEWPPLLGYRALQRSLEALTGAACPGLAAALGQEDFLDFVRMLGAKCIITCFANLLPLEPLLALWNQLLFPGALPQRPLYVWFLGLCKHLEEPLAELLAGVDQDEPKAPQAFQAALEAARALPQGWRPREGLAPEAVHIVQILASAEESLRAEAEAARLQKLFSVPAATTAALQQEFKQLPAAPGGGLSLETVQEALTRAFPSASSAPGSAQQLYQLLDRDGSGSLDFFELMTGIYLLCDLPWETKLHRLFAFYDTDESGFLDRDELLCLAQILVKMTRGMESPDAYGPVTSDCAPSSIRAGRRDDVPVGLRRRSSLRAKERLSAEQFRRGLLIADTNGDGKVSWEEFSLGVRSNPDLLHSLASAGISPTSKGREFSGHLVEEPSLCPSQ